ncbi:MAG: LppX_LprAFG lipoprotein [Nocardioidaceae bacterium]
MTSLRTRLASLLALPLLAAAALSGCSGGETSDTATPREVLAAAKQQLDETSGVRVGLSTEKLPPGVSGLLDAQGVGTHAPAFEGDITVAASGVTVDAQVVAVAGQVHAKLPFTTAFRPIDPATYGAPDPADLMRPDGGLSSLLTAAEKIQAGKQVREGKAVLRSYTATVPGTAVAAVIPSADATATFSAVFTVADDDRLATAVLSGPFYPDADSVTYTVTFADYGTATTITAP